MRVIIATWAHRSHYYPLVPLGRALLAAGHDVRIAAQPDAAELVAPSGIPFAAVGPRLDLDAIVADVRVPAPPDAGPVERERARAETAVRMFAAGSRLMADDMLEFARGYRPDVIIYEPRIYAALRAARDLGVPAVRALAGGTDYTYVRERIEHPILAPLWKRLGLDGAGPHGDLTIDPCPPSLQVPGELPRRRMRYLPYNGGGSAPDWVHGPVTRPRIVVTWGVTFARHHGHLDPVRRAVDAVGELDADVIVAVFSEHAALLGELPPHARLIQSMPLQLLLPSCAAVIHQGGAGTMMTAAACGVPQFIMPSFGDEPDNARQLARQGAGRTVPLADADRATIRDNVAALIDEPGHREAAAGLREEIERQPSPADVAGALAELAG